MRRPGERRRHARSRLGGVSRAKAAEARCATRIREDSRIATKMPRSGQAGSRCRGPALATACRTPSSSDHAPLQSEPKYVRSRQTIAAPRDFSTARPLAVLAKNSAIRSGSRPGCRLSASPKAWSRTGRCRLMASFMEAAAAAAPTWSAQRQIRLRMGFAQATTSPLPVARPGSLPCRAGPVVSSAVHST